jgi:undecaprenyl-diphosphatase
MSYFQAILLSLVQALSEFLPISSSGHLILLPRLLGWADQGLLFDEALNTGTMLAVMLYFRADLTALVRDGLASLRERRWVGQGKLCWYFGLATLPAGLLGLVIHEWVATAARNPTLVAVNLIAYGILLAAVDRWARQEREVGSVRLKDALLIGCAQALSLVPGTSRSGITMTMGRFLGFERAAAARFSFLLSVPIGLAVAVHDGIELTKAGTQGTSWTVLVAAVLATAAFGYVVIDALLVWVRKQSFLVFAIYRVILGLIILSLPALAAAP